ncbi:hypothetical protein GTA08_BOTSDO09740 [Botryosphaeria dothidea]|uniref:S-adenosyl-L-methionine-dependent methyltransferase n=1 Tax=Botryosphaeria dothidea TaxID=55169 RepID=A0A8H4IJV8_9PEZI|nr:hypothetical protein GTA08_BOTSDO09740 [Botryosphaeria dothidea]
MATSEDPKQQKSGRSYHDTPSAYVLPNDDLEHSRLDRQADSIAAMLGGRITRANLSPNSVTKVLDIGCGTGAATITLAQLYPSAAVYGLDISHVPDAGRAAAPSNVTFIEGDFLDTFPSLRSRETKEPEKGGEDAAADEQTTNPPTTTTSPLHPALRPSTLTHLYGRMLILGIPSWRAYFATARALLAPGAGVLEHHDVDLDWYAPSLAAPPPPLSASWPWTSALHAALAKTGHDVRCGSRAAGRMREAGFVDVRTEGPFAFAFTRNDEEFPGSGRCADYVAEYLGEGFRELVRKVVGGGGEVDEETLEGWLKRVEGDMLGQMGTHFRYWVTVGRRPGEGEEGGSVGV